MKRHPLIAVAFLVHAAAWFLPVAKDGVTFPDDLTGWQAFLGAFLLPLGVLMHEGAFSAKSVLSGVLSELSAISTVLFVLGAWWVVAKGTSEDRRFSAWVAGCAFAVNAHWLRLPSLRIGYYLWWVSFLLLAIGLLRLSRAPQSELQSQSDISPS